jgi:hypothetical protein
MTLKDKVRAITVITIWLVALAWVIWITRYLSITATLLGCLGISWLVVYLARGFR